jgi:pre-mRNA-processing factor 17
VPYVVQFYPHDDNFFVVGCSDNKIVTYDATTAEITQEYNHHLGPVNAILFVEDHGTKMITSSDDKKVLIWEWDIGVPIKYISDPAMHSMPCMALHPAALYFAGQSLDNTIVVFQARDRFAMQRKKKFSGHQVSGYACELTFSPDGQFLVSGDGNGNIFFWLWKGHKYVDFYFCMHDMQLCIDLTVFVYPLSPPELFKSLKRTARDRQRVACGIPWNRRRCLHVDGTE